MILSMNWLLAYYVDKHLGYRN